MRVSPVRCWGETGASWDVAYGLGWGLPPVAPPMAALTSVHIDRLLAAVSVGTIPITVFIVITRCQRVCKGKRVTRGAPVFRMG